MNESNRVGEREREGEREGAAWCFNTLRYTNTKYSGDSDSKAITCFNDENIYHPEVQIDILKRTRRTEAYWLRTDECSGRKKSLKNGCER